MNNLPTKDLTDDFWNDCINNQISTPLNIIFPYKNFSKTLGRNNDKEKIKRKSKYILNLYSFRNGQNNTKKNDNSSIIKHKNKAIETPTFTKIYNNHPLLHENNLNSKEDKEIQRKKKNALLRCLGLYAYGLEVKKEKLLNDENSKKEKIKEEILPCTFKPKISKYSHNKKPKFLTDIINRNKYKQNEKNNIIVDYKMTTTLSEYDNGAIKKNSKNKNINSNNKNNDLIENTVEYTFKPKLIKRNVNKVFSQDKSIEIEKDNEQFILRYNKARENYMTKKLKQISSRDECYNTLLNVFNHFSNKHQRNKQFRYSMNEYKNENESNWENKRTINVDKSVIQSLRNELLSIDLNDDI